MQELLNLLGSQDHKESFLCLCCNKYVSRQQHPRKMLKRNQSTEYFFKLKNTSFLENGH